MRNFSFEVKEGKFLLKGVGRSSIVAECDQKKLEGLVNKIVSSTFLELLGCKFEDENGNSVSLGKQLFLVLRDERLYYKHWKGNRAESFLTLIEIFLSVYNEFLLINDDPSHRCGQKGGSDYGDVSPVALESYDPPVVEG
jgi:hypothetical protein